MQDLQERNMKKAKKADNEHDLWKQLNNSDNGKEKQRSTDVKKVTLTKVKLKMTLKIWHI